MTDLTYAGDATMVQLGSTATYARFLIVSPDGMYQFRVGGTLNVGTNQQPGAYNGTFEVLLNLN